MQHETLEARQLLAADVVPQLVGIQPNVGELILEGDVRGTSPRTLTFNFADIQEGSGDEIDPTTLESGIIITRAGLDGKLGTADDVQIVGPNANFEGFIGIGDRPNQVVVRFGEALPDDLYRIEITGDLQDMEGESAVPFVRNFELNLAPQVMSVVPQPITRNAETGLLEIARDTIHVYFNDDDLDPTLATNPDYYQLSYQLSDSDNNNSLGLQNGELAFYPSEVYYDAELDMAILKFDKPIDKLVSGNTSHATVFRLQVGVKGIASKPSEILDLVGDDAGSSFFTARDLSNYLGTVQTEDGNVQYQNNPVNLFQGNHEFQVTRGATVDANRDGAIDVVGTTFDIQDGLGNQRRFELTLGGSVASGTIAIDISGLGDDPTELANAIRDAINAQSGANFRVEVSNVVSNPARMQLRGTGENRVSMVLGTQSTGLIVDQTQALTIRGEIRNTWNYNINLPGSNDEPGHRDINSENHLWGPADQDGMNVTRITYNFPTIYGQDPASPTQEPFRNQITPPQMERAREILAIYSFYAGIEFVEVPADVVADVGIITGDLRAIAPEVTTGQGDFERGFGYLRNQYGEPIDQFGNPTTDPSEWIPVVIMETGDHQGIGADEVGAQWQMSAFDAIGNFLGIGRSNDLPPGTNNGSEDALDFGQGVEPLLPGDFDITHLQHLHRPDSLDIDMYRFEVTETGRLSAEIVAERLADSSLLNSALTLYRQNGDGSYTPISRNDDYFSKDAYLEMTLEPGTYFIGVSASGNNVYDPNIEDSGFGGRTQGIYNLQLRFSPNVTEAIRDRGSSQQRISSLVVQAGGDAFTDGQTITLRDGTQTRVFEIDIVQDLDDAATVSNAAHIPVKILASSLQSEVVAALVNAINEAEGFNVVASSVGNRIDLANLATNNPITLDASLIVSGALVSGQGESAGAALDGDLDGTAGGAFNFWFRAEPTTDADPGATADKYLQINDIRSLESGDYVTVTASSTAGGTPYTIVVEMLSDGDAPSQTTNAASRRIARSINLDDIQRIGGQSRDELLAKAIAAAINDATDTIRNGGEGFNALPSSVRFNLAASAGGRQVALNFDTNVTVTAADPGALEAIEENIPPNAPRTLFVDATYTAVQGRSPDGSLMNPYRTIQAAINAAAASGRGDVIRIVGLPGISDDATTLGDNVAYLIGRDAFGNPLKDGTDIILPKGVTMMIDEGAILKFSNSSIFVGSTSDIQDRSYSSFQILGIPERYSPSLDASGNPIVDTERLNRRVTLTSFNETTYTNDPEGDRIGNASNTLRNATPGDWGGIFLNNEIDREENRGSFEDRGIFLNSIIGADIRYAGGTVQVDGQATQLAPIYMEEVRPTINFNTLHFNAGAALSADPNSLEESNYSVYQGASATFTSDVTRVGPDIFGNRIVNNSQNGMMVRIRSLSGSPREELTVTARMDDTDIVYIIQDALHINSNPGGPTSDMVDLLKVNSLQGIESGDVLFVTARDNSGNPVFLAIEFLRDGDTPALSQGDDVPGDNVPVGATLAAVRTVDLDNLAPQTEEQLAQLLVNLLTQARNDAQVYHGGAVNLDAFADRHMVQLTPTATASFTGGSAVAFEPMLQARLNASLVVDPNVVVKFNAGRIEVEMGANFVAEGAPGRPVVFTSLRDDRYGFGGTFDTNNNGAANAPAPGDWSGIYFAHTSSGSIDNAIIAYAGGVSGVSGELTNFNAIEIHQADVRLTNSILEYNADGHNPANPNPTRYGHMTNDDAVVFVRGAQPVIVGNNFRFNDAPVLNVDLSSLNHQLVVDWGRSTGNLDIQPGLADNQGALIRRNVLTDNGLNAMVVRGGTLTTQSVWDDTDIVHAVFEQITSSDFHTYGGIRLESSATESLVVKLFGDEAGFVATGRQLDIDDRIGGMLHVIGQPGFPVVFTDLRDDSVGAGFTQYGTPQNDTNNDGSLTTPQPGAWSGLLIDQFAHDRNVQVVVEREGNNLTGAGSNATPQTSQPLGQLAPHEYAGSDNRRLGFEVNGFLSNPADVDVYSFVATPGTEVWFDIDRSSYFLDPVIELVDVNGNVLVGSTTSFDGSGNSFYGTSGMLRVTNPLQKSGFYEEDFWSINPRDAGMRVVLPGEPGSTPRTYHVRIRSGSENLMDPSVTGVTAGVYQLNIRLREIDELAGSTIQFADIRYAQNGITVLGQPTHSPVLGESAEDQNNNNDTKANAHKLGNVLNSDRAALSVAGFLSGTAGKDVDWYEFQLNFDSVQSTTGSNPESAITWDPNRGGYAALVLDLDYAAGAGRANSIISVFDQNGQLVFTSSNSSINDDQTHPQSPGQSDLSRGSSGVGDPYLGTIMLPAGTPENPITYYVAVSSEAQEPVQLDQFVRSDATNTMVRLEPINSVHRIVEDHMGDYLAHPDGYAYPIYSTPNPPDHTSIIRNESAKQFLLGDFVLFMSRDTGTEQTQLVAIDPFTGAMEANIGKFNRDIRDMLMAPDGTLYAYSVDTRPGANTPDDAQSGNILQIDTGDASIQNLRDDGIITYIQNINDGSKVVVGDHPDPAQEGKANGDGWGYQFEGTTFAYDRGDGHADFLRAYAIGNRGDVSPSTGSGNANSEFANILFLMDASDTDGDNRPLLTPQTVVTAQHVAGNILNNPGHTNASSAIARVDTSVGGGGFITGLGWVGSELYGVSSTGALYRISNGAGGFNNAGGVITPTLLVDTAFNFTSLTAGPKNPAGTTDYSDVLFALDSAGNVHAFTTDGEEAHVFQGGRSRIATGISSAHGLQFGTLNRNLWHLQNETLHTTDAGHGLTIPVDNSRVAITGGTTLYFGNQMDKYDQNGSAYGNKTTDDYNFPGDAHGSVISDPFSLYGYNSADLPTLYFNYLLDTDGKDYDPMGGSALDNEPARDTLRVFAAGEDGQWHLLATNNTFKASDIGPYPGGEFDDEFDRYGYSFQNGTTKLHQEVSDLAVDEALRAQGVNGTEGIQQLFDNTGWRQARVDLSAFAGQENIRLRFDFATGGSINMGGYNLGTGVQDNTEELRFQSGDRIADGAVFEVVDRMDPGTVWTFEFNKGQTFTFGSGSQINDAVNQGSMGDRFTLTTAPDPDNPGAPQTSHTFQYVRRLEDLTAGNIPILFSLSDTPAEIAEKTREAIDGAMPSSVTLHAGDLSVPTTANHALNVRGIVDLPQGEVISGLVVTGSGGTVVDPTTNPTHVIIEYNAGDSAAEVALLAQEMMHIAMTPDAHSQGFTIFQVHEEFLYGTNYAFNVGTSGIGHDNYLEGDDFGISGLAGIFDLNDANDNTNRRGQDNLHQGVFIDDIIIGFAERGEMVTGAANNATGYTTNTDLRRNEILTGEYQLEIRRSIDYGIQAKSGQLILDPTWKFDTNDRLVEGYSVKTPAGHGLATGNRIRISDGTDTVVFEFFDLDSNEFGIRGFDGSATRRAYDAANNIYSIGFRSDFSESDVARALMTAINDRAGHVARGLINTTQGELGVDAQVNARNGNTTRGQVDLSRRTHSDEVIVTYDKQSDDSFREAYATGLDGNLLAAGTNSEVRILGAIGDHDPINKGDGIADIDVYDFRGVDGQTIRLTFDDHYTGTSGLNSTVRLFFQNGASITEVFPTEVLGAAELVLEYTIPTGGAGRYFVVVAANTAPLAINGNQASTELNYNANQVPRNDAARQTRTYEGHYSLSVRVGDDVNQIPVASPEIDRRPAASGQPANPLAESTDLGNNLFIERYSPLRYDAPLVPGGLPIPTMVEVNEFNDAVIKVEDHKLGTLRVTGDENRQRDQGQIILSSNTISYSSEYGILIDGGVRDTETDQGSDGNRPHQGAPRNFASAQNTARLATGVTITNNVIHDGGKGGIRYSGDNLGGSNPQGAVPFGRIINNTLYGIGSGDVGIKVDEAAGPTLMNNIVANFGTGISVDSSSQPNTVINRTLYQNNDINSTTTVGTLPILLDPSEPLFVNAANRNFYLAYGSRAIDAAVDSMQERAEVSQVVNPLGIPNTPLLAPDRDITGQLRDFDPDASTGGGVGENTFRDIGAFDRADSTGPTAFLLDPRDNDAAGNDLDRAENVVQLISGPLSTITIQLLDEGEIASQGAGTGIDASTVKAESVKVEIIGQPDPLIEGVDYRFDYDATNNIIRLIPISGVFQENTLYKITLDSDPETDDAVIRDLADNPISFNKEVLDDEGNLVGETSFYVQAGGLVDFGDAPDSYGTTLANNGARHNLKADFYLGASVDAEIDGSPSPNADADAGDDGIYIQTPDPNDSSQMLPFTLRDVSKNEIYITATVPQGSQSFGFLDAWIDFNNNGIFEPNEQILTNLALTADAIDPLSSPSGKGQLVTIQDLPNTDYVGTTFARFRFSSTGGLAPTGLAEDGEVEDYAVTLGAPGVNPWHNTEQREAVSTKDNIVTGVDLNLLIRELTERNYTYSKDDAPPGKIAGDFRPGFEPDKFTGQVPAFFDVNNDFRVTSLDLLLVRNYLTGSVNPEPLEQESIAGSMAQESSTVTDVTTPVGVGAYEFQESDATSVAPAPSATPSIIEASPQFTVGSSVGIEASAFDAIAPSYAELEMRSALELMGFTRSTGRSLGSVDVSFVDEAIALDELVTDDQFENLIGAMADELSVRWDGKQLDQDPEAEEDDLDELLALLSQSDE